MKIVKAEHLKAGDKVVLMRRLEENAHGYVGTLLEVLAVDSPFIIVMEPKFPESRFPIDTRRVEIGIPSDEYVAALTRKSIR